MARGEHAASTAAAAARQNDDTHDRNDIQHPTVRRALRPRAAAAQTMTMRLLLAALGARAAATPAPAAAVSLAAVGAAPFFPSPLFNLSFTALAAPATAPAAALPIALVADEFVDAAAYPPGSAWTTPGVKTAPAGGAAWMVEAASLASPGQRFSFGGGVMNISNVDMCG